MKSSRSRESARRILPLPRTTVSTSDTEQEPARRTPSRSSEQSHSSTPLPSSVSADLTVDCEMGSIQKVTKESISIIRTCTMSFNDCKVRNPRSLRYKQSGTLAVPHWQQRVRPDNKQHRTIFNANKPALFKTGKSIEN